MNFRKITILTIRHKRHSPLSARVRDECFYVEMSSETFTEYFAFFVISEFKMADKTDCGHSGIIN